MKKIIKITAIVIVWVGCGYINWGLTMGAYTHDDPWGSHTDIAVEMAIGGVAALPVTYFGGSPGHHWLVKPYTTEQRWEAFHKHWPSLSREYFEQEYN